MRLGGLFGWIFFGCIFFWVVVCLWVISFFFLLDIKMMILFFFGIKYIIFGLFWKNYYRNLRRVSGLCFCRGDSWRVRIGLIFFFLYFYLNWFLFSYKGSIKGDNSTLRSNAFTFIFFETYFTLELVWRLQSHIFHKTNKKKLK